MVAQQLGVHAPGKDIRNNISAAGKERWAHESGVTVSMEYGDMNRASTYDTKNKKERPAFGPA